MPNLSIPQAAALLGITPRAIRAACARGHFPGAHKPGRDWMIPTEAVDYYRENHLGQVGRPPAPSDGGGAEAERSEK